MSNTYLSEGNQIVLKEKFKIILINFITDYDEDKWFNDEVYKKYSNELLKQFNIIIADLEAKLAESEKYAEYNIPKLIEANKMMSKQLAEKEKMLDKLEDKLHHYYEETLNKGTCGLCEHLRTEYKTDFAIEQLEKVKEIMSKSNENGYIIRFASMNDRDKFNETINNQIKELKEKK